MREDTINPTFFQVFCSWFNVDLIDLRDTQEVDRAAGICASDLAKQVPDVDGLIRGLNRMLSEWAPSTIMQFIHATDTDWLADAETEHILRRIVEGIVAGL